VVRTAYADNASSVWRTVSRQRSAAQLTASAARSICVYLDAEVQSRLSRLPNAIDVDFSTLVNNVLRKDIEIIEMAK
jgi:hypothetical protein